MSISGSFSRNSSTILLKAAGDDAEADADAVNVDDDDDDAGWR